MVPLTSCITSVDPKALQITDSFGKFSPILKFLVAAQSPHNWGDMVLCCLAGCIPVQLSSVLLKMNVDIIQFILIGCFDLF